MTDDTGSITNAYDLIEQYWPYDGPYSHERTAGAALMVERLVRYLNNATQKPSAMPCAQTGGEIVGALRSAVAGLDQLLSQLSDFYARQAQDPTLYDDRRDRPGAQTAYELAEELDDLRGALSDVWSKCNRAANLSSHLGNDIAE